MVSKFAAARNYFSKFWDAGFLFSNAFIPLVFLTLYFVSFSYILPEGVNNVFADRSWKLSLVMTAAVGLVFLALFKLKKGGKITLKKPAEKISASDFILLLLPLTPVVQYILSNQDILSIWESFYVFGIFAIFSAFFILAVPKFLGFVGSTRTLSLLGMAFSFTIINMAALSQQFAWLEVGSLRIQLAVFGGLFLASWFLYDLKQKLLYFLIAAYFVSNTAVQAFTPHENKANTAAVPYTDNKLVQLVEDRKPPSTPNIYLLIYDAYAHNETMLSYGIDNSAQEKHLQSLGFKLYPRTYSIGASSTNTMSRVFNASIKYYGNMRRGVSGDGVVQNLLKGLGYKTYGVFTTDYFFRGTKPSYDFSFPKVRASSQSSSSRLLSKAVLLGEFRFDLEFDKEPIDNFFAAKRDVFEKNFKDQIFIYVHGRFPGHSQNSGACLPNETQLFKERLQKGSVEMRQDLEIVIKNDPNAIVIVAGDHGPYLTKNCLNTGLAGDISEVSRLDIQDRFGTFLAIRWPTKDFEEYDDITVLQDLFPSIFAYLFKDETLLEAKVEPKTLEPYRVSGASVKNGIIYGGIDNGEPLFESR